MVFSLSKTIIQAKLFTTSDFHWKRISEDWKNECSKSCDAKVRSIEYTKC